MDYNELLLASAVRELASQIKSNKSHEYWMSLNGSPDQNQRRDQWDAEHQTIAFVPEALAQLRAVADVIRTEKP